MINLHLGCGKVHIEGMVNIDQVRTPATDIICDVCRLPYADSTCQLIYSSHCIEHIHYEKTLDTLKEWSRVLMPGGKLRIYTPDFDRLIRDYYWHRADVGDYRSADLIDRIKAYICYMLSSRYKKLVPGLVGVIVGHDDSSPHRALFTWQSLKEQLEQTGFVKVKRLKRSSRWPIDDASKTCFSLAVECEKK